MLAAESGGSVAFDCDLAPIQAPRHAVRNRGNECGQRDRLRASECLVAGDDAPLAVAGEKDDGAQVGAFHVPLENAYRVAVVRASGEHAELLFGGDERIEAECDVKVVRLGIVLGPGERGDQANVRSRMRREVGQKPAERWVVEVEDDDIVAEELVNAKPVSLDDRRRGTVAWNGRADVNSQPVDASTRESSREAILGSRRVGHGAKGDCAFRYLRGNTGDSRCSIPVSVRELRAIPDDGNAGGRNHLVCFS